MDAHIIYSNKLRMLPNWDIIQEACMGPEFRKSQDEMDQCGFRLIGRSVKSQKIQLEVLIDFLRMLQNQRYLSAIISVVIESDIRLFLRRSIHPSQTHNYVKV